MINFVRINGVFSASLRGGLFSLLDVSGILTFLFSESHLFAGFTVVIES